MKYLLINGLLLTAAIAGAQLETIRTLTPEQGQEVRRPVEAKIFGASADALPALEAELLDLFQSSETTLEGKQYACRMLRHCGSDASIPVLAPELDNPELSQFVRRVFQSLETPAANDALIAALPTVGTELQIGIIGTLGQMGSSKSVAAIAPYLGNTALQSVTITALGNIGGKEAYKALASARVKPEHSNQWKMAQLKCAEMIQFDSLNRNAAEKFYTSFLQDDNEEIQCAAMVGFVKAAPDEGAELVLENLDGEGRLHATTRGLLTKLSTEELVDELGELDDEDQLLVISELSDRKAAKAEAALLGLTDNDTEAVRNAAFQALGMMGGTKSIQPLLAAIENPIAYNALCGLNAEGCNAALIQTLETSDDKKLQGKIIECLTARQATVALPAFVEIAKGDWSRNGKTAIDGMAKLVVEQDFQLYVELMLSSDDKKKTAALEQSIITASQRLPDTEMCAQPLIAAFGKAEDHTKCAIVQTLGGIGGEASRILLTQALASPDPKIRDAAIRGLANWPTLDAADQLLEIATTAETEKQQVIALRGYIRLAYTVDNPEENLAMCKKAAAATDRPAELKNIIGCVKKNKNKQVLAFLTVQLDNPDVFTEAGWAICEVSRQRNLKVSAIPTLERIAETTDQQLAGEAKKRLKNAGAGPSQ